MAIRVGINGFGRIGRLVFRSMAGDPDIEIVAVNGSADYETMVHLIKYDTIQGPAFEYAHAVKDGFVVDGHHVKVVYDRVPANLPWKKLGVDVVLESTGAFCDAHKSQAHIDAGAKKVIITAPGKNEDLTVVMGVNDHLYDPEKHHIVSNASCTTNCLAPVAKVLLEEFGIERGFMNTIHAYTGGQKIQDAAHKDLRRARAANMSMIPTTTGAARAVAKVLPELKGKLDGFATRVPTPDGSMVNLTAVLGQEVTVDDVNMAMRAAAYGPLKGILRYTEDPIVSNDVIGDPHSSVFDASLTKVMNGKGDYEKGDMINLVAWYDNEWGYSNRLKDLVKIMM